MMKALIVDDSSASRNALQTMLSQECSSYVTVVKELTSCEAAISWLRANETAVDLVFLDMDLGDGIGFDVLNALTAIHFAVIFCTAYNQFALEAHQYSPIGFLVKPISREDLKKNVLFAASNLYRKATNKRQRMLTDEVVAVVQRGHGEITVKSRDSTPIILQSSNIIFIKALDKYCECTIADGKTLFLSESLGTMERSLRCFDFLRVARSFMINLHRIRGLHKEQGRLRIDLSGHTVYGVAEVFDEIEPWLAYTQRSTTTVAQQ
jgi:two-component system LytT family response regulator